MKRSRKSSEGVRDSDRLTLATVINNAVNETLKRMRVGMNVYR